MESWNLKSWPEPLESSVSFTDFEFESPQQTSCRVPIFLVLWYSKSLSVISLQIQFFIIILMYHKLGTTDKEGQSSGKCPATEEHKAEW